MEPHMLRTCVNCGKEFNNTGNTRGRFCCKSCYNDYRRTKPPEYKQAQYVDLVCPVCGKEFKKRVAELAHGRTHYCSRTCAGNGAGGTVTQRSKPQPSVNKTCLQCGSEFKVKPSRINETKFCSDACCRAYRSVHMVGEGNPNHRHGKNQTSARRIAFTYYPQKCVICGFDVVVNVHHITPKNEGGTNKPANLAVLCPNHHAMADLNLLNREELAEYAHKALIKAPP